MHAPKIMTKYEKSIKAKYFKWTHKYRFEVELKLLLIPDFISMRVFVSISRWTFPGGGIRSGMIWGTETEPAVIFSQQWSLK